MREKYINIKYPFQDSPKGFFLDMNKVDAGAIKSDLMHLILTQRGQRLYNPNFGTNLMKYIFEPNDEITWSDVRGEINDVIKIYIPELSIFSIELLPVDEGGHITKLKISYTITDGVFKSDDLVEMLI